MMLQRTPAKELPVPVKQQIGRHAAARRAEAKPRVVWKMGARQHRDMIEMLLPYCREAQPTAFAAEGPGRQRLRAKLCLQGWKWAYADQEAAALMHAVLERVGARRPTWGEGQLEYTNDAFLRDDYCLHCSSPLPAHAKKFCCDLHRRLQMRLHMSSMYDMIIM